MKIKTTRPVLYILLALLLAGTIGQNQCLQAQSKSISVWGFSGFTKPQENPILGADSTKSFFCPVKQTEVKWQRADVFNPGAITHNGKVYLLTRCEDNPKAILGGRTSRIGLASSTDGIHFDYYPKPVLYPDTDEFAKYDHMGGCEDPRVVKTEEGLFVMLYTSWNYDTPRLSVATSKDLIHWEKKGPAFAKAYGGKFLNMATKSGSIVTRMNGEDIVVAKFGGKYYMYWGENAVNLAISDNLTDWYPTLDKEGNLSKVITIRKGFFDSGLTECGPPALLTGKGILLLYNGKNADNENADPQLPRGTYSVGQVLLDAENPEKVLKRADTCILKPTLPHEVTGQYKAGTVFGEGLVYFRNKWFLYYGTADSYIGVAVSDVKL
ncbi:MAG: glycoside hydrolase family 130 protein [Prolixibacteraceae bacterium]|jgi:predicted GH43/DUF377 family glycosyl hydrolase